MSRRTDKQTQSAHNIAALRMKKEELRHGEFMLNGLDRGMRALDGLLLQHLSSVRATRSRNARSGTELIAFAEVLLGIQQQHQERKERR